MPEYTPQVRKLNENDTHIVEKCVKPLSAINFYGVIGTAEYFIIALADIDAVAKLLQFRRYDSYIYLSPEQAYLYAPYELRTVIYNQNYKYDNYKYGNKTSHTTYSQTYNQTWDRPKTQFENDLDYLDNFKYAPAPVPKKYNFDDVIFDRNAFDEPSDHEFDDILARCNGLEEYKRDDSPTDQLIDPLDDWGVAEEA